MLLYLNSLQQQHDKTRRLKGKPASEPPPPADAFADGTGGEKERADTILLPVLPASSYHSSVDPDTGGLR